MSWYTVDFGLMPPASPKFRWVMESMRELGVVYRLNGESFDAPVLEVYETSRATADRLSSPVSALEGHDALFSSGSCYPWWCLLDPDQEPQAGITAGAVGVVAYKVRSTIARDVRCIPTAAEDQTSCPLSSGAISSCPQSLWPLCGHMVRLERHLIPMAGVLGGRDEDAIQLAGEILEAVRIRKDDGFADAFDRSAGLCVLAAERIENGRLEGLCGERADEIVRQILEETPSGTAGINVRRV